VIYLQSGEKKDSSLAFILMRLEIFGSLLFLISIGHILLQFGLNGLYWGAQRMILGLFFW